MGKYANINKMIELSMKSWEEAFSYNLTDIRTIGNQGNKLIDKNGHKFINMCCCSYLGLNRHPSIIEGAISALRQEGTMTISVSRARIGPKLLDEVEDLMSKLFGCEAVITLSCTAASVGALPILASGHFTDGKKPIMIFDKNSHFSMNIMKASCGDETEIITGEHNNMDYLEDMCKKHDKVAYIADGAYSMGGNAPMKDLLSLQDKYGLFLYLDDSHSISVHGDKGVGLVRSQIDNLGSRTIIVGSLAKAFGATGGIIMLGNQKQKKLLSFCGGPLSWSQMVNAAGLGAILASAKLHFSPELKVLQNKLQENMQFFDSQISTVNAGNGLPIRVIDLITVDEALRASQNIYQKGFYSSPVFFPIIAYGKAGLRAMGRADFEKEDMMRFCDAIKPYTSAKQMSVT